MLEKDFTTDEYAALLAKLKDNNYLTQKDIDLLLKDALEQNSILLTSISLEKAEIVRKALLESAKQRKF